jgi:hypothetical protein
MTRTGIVLCCAVVTACTDTTGPDPAVISIEVTNLVRQENGQWLAEFRIANIGTSTVFLPQCDEVVTGLESWTGSDWTPALVESCLPDYDHSRLVLNGQAVVLGDRVLAAPGRYRLHVRYARETDVDFDRIAVTDPIDIR